MSGWREKDMWKNTQLSYITYVLEQTTVKSTPQDCAMKDLSGAQRLVFHEMQFEWPVIRMAVTWMAVNFNRE